MMSAIERFIAGILIDESTDCWLWQKVTRRDGYVAFRDDGEKVLIHRWAYAFFRERIPVGLKLDHLCRNRHCCNPWHLEIVSQHDNVYRSPTALAAINSRKTHCAHGHEFTRANTYRVPGRSGRNCRACHKTAARRWVRNNWIKKHVKEAAS